MRSRVVALWIAWQWVGGGSASAQIVGHSLSRLCDRDSALESLQWLKHGIDSTAVVHRGDTLFIERRLREDSALAYRFAPVLWFAPTEQDFPTMPFFTVWDTVDNNGNGRRDFRDSDEVAMLDSTGRASWDTGLNWYRYIDTTVDGKDTFKTDPSRSRAINLRRSSVFYRVCDLSPGEVRDLFRILRLDEQAWQRLQLDYTFPSESTPFRVVQYHLYYFRDSGLQGHPHDTEKVFVFTPADTAIGFYVVVGAGHTSRVPNNVLIRFAPREGANTLSDTLQVIVELGGHSSAPDLYPRGQFDAGSDVNWQIYDLWGTRDVQAAGGIGYMGNYRPGMGFVRDPADLRMVRLYPPSEPSSSVHQRRIALMRTLGGDTAHAVSLPLERYRLVPINLFRRLIEDLDTWKDTLPPAELPFLVGDIQDALGLAQPAFLQLKQHEQLTALQAMKRYWRLPLLYLTREEKPRRYGRPPVQREACAPLQSLALRLRDWSPAMPWHERADSERPIGARCYTDPRKHRIWESPAYHDAPTKIFKEHLFRPSMLSLRKKNLGDWLRLVTYGITRYGAGAWDVHLGFVVPAYRSHWVPVRLPGFVELQGGRYTSNLSDPSGPHSSYIVSLNWEMHRNAWFAGYLRPSWVPKRSEAMCHCSDPADRFSDFSIGGGVSLLPFLAPNRPKPVFVVPNVVRIDIGVRLDLGDWGDATRRLAWEIQLRTRQ